ncbi:hypothetical protein LIER_33906 [Lithospermum erythrorhizon]|uniref:GRF-type domain-containing protein n=1 Tax=Lithospermum erythrorhizon TaxID=34254 RepID=A0AAV3RY56_LITER
MCIKLVSTTKENPGRLFFACPIPRLCYFNGGHGWIDWVDRTSFQSGSSSVHSGGRFEAFDLVLKEKNEKIAQLELENKQISNELFEEKLHTRIVVVLATGWLRLLLAFSFFLGFIGASGWIVGCGGVYGGASCGCA